MIHTLGPFRELLLVYGKNSTETELAFRNLDDFTGTLMTTDSKEKMFLMFLSYQNIVHD